MACTVTRSEADNQMRDVPIAEVKDVLVPVDGSDASLDALGMACRLVQKRKGSVYAIYVIEVDRALPLDADLYDETAAGEAVLKDARSIGRKWDTEIQAEILQARDAAQAISSEAIERKVDAVIMGIEHDRPFGEFQLQRHAQQILKHTPCQVWVCRRGIQE